MTTEIRTPRKSAWQVKRAQQRRQAERLDEMGVPVVRHTSPTWDAISGCVEGGLPIPPRFDVTTTLAAIATADTQWRTDLAIVRDFEDERLAHEAIWDRRFAAGESVDWSGIDRCQVAIRRHWRRVVWSLAAMCGYLAVLPMTERERLVEQWRRDVRRAKAWASGQGITSGQLALIHTGGDIPNLLLHLAIVTCWANGGTVSLRPLTQRDVLVDRACIVAQRATDLNDMHRWDDRRAALQQERAS